MNQTGGHGRLIRNVIILLDLIMFNAVGALYTVSCVQEHSSELVGSNILIILSFVNGALAVSQLFFCTIIHKHYKSFDRVIRQYSSLMFTFAITLCLVNIVAKYAFDVPCPSMLFWTILTAYQAMALFLMRVFEYTAIKKLRLFGWDRNSILFVGDASQIAIAYDNLDSLIYSGVRVIGYYSDSRMEKEISRMPYLGTIDDLMLRVNNSTNRFVDEIYCATSSNKAGFVPLLVDYATRNAVQFNYIPTFSNGFGQYLKPRVVGEAIVFSNLSEPLMSFSNRFIKRLFDIVFSGIVVLIMLPFIPIIGLCIKLSSPGPVFFRQKRTGLDGRTFDMLKFRSMHVNKQADTQQCTENDPRKFAFGDFIRRKNIDEFPQFLNVLKGDMSIVGPRPHMIVQTNEYRLKIYEYMLRHIVRPGITGWAQVTGFRGETSELWQMEGRVKRDLWYIQNWSFWLDIRIIFRTMMSFFTHDSHAY